jgi:hypothetical protein
MPCALGGGNQIGRLTYASNIGPKKSLSEAGEAAAKALKIVRPRSWSLIHDRPSTSCRQTT